MTVHVEILNELKISSQIKFVTRVNSFIPLNAVTVPRYMLTRNDAYPIRLYDVPYEKIKKDRK